MYYISYVLELLKAWQSQFTKILAHIISKIHSRLHKNEGRGLTSLSRKRRKSTVEKCQLSPSVRNQVQFSSSEFGPDHLLT